MLNGWLSDALLPASNQYNSVSQQCVCDSQVAPDSSLVQRRLLQAVASKTVSAGDQLLSVNKPLVALFCLGLLLGSCKDRFAGHRWKVYWKHGSFRSFENCRVERRKRSGVSKILSGLKSHCYDI